MKRILFSILSIVLFSTSALAQNQTISFEENEGYTLGTVIDQNQWSQYGYLFNNFANVVNEGASVGERAVKVDANYEQEENWGGLVYPLNTMNKFIISADVKFDGDMGSDYDMLSLYSEIDDEFEYVSGFYFVYTGETSFGNETSSVSPFEWTPNTWYNLKSDVDFDTRQVKLFVNNALVNTFSIPSEIQTISEVDFEFDNYETGYTLDNVQIVDLSNLGLTKQPNSQLHIYPNPTSDWLTIESKNQIQSIKILDFTGKLISTIEGKSRINVENLNQGIYFIQTTTDKGSETKKFIKK